MAFQHDLRPDEWDHFRSSDDPSPSVFEDAPWCSDVDAGAPRLVEKKGTAEPRFAHEDLAV